MPRKTTTETGMADDLPGSEPAHAVGAQQADGALAAHLQRESSRDGEHRQGGDEGDDPPIGDRRRVDQAEEEPEAERSEDEGQRSGIDHQAPGDARGGDDRADREVDAGRGDHERHPDGEDADDARLGDTARRLSAVGNVEGLRMAPMTISTTMTPPRVYSCSFTPGRNDKCAHASGLARWG